MKTTQKNSICGLRFLAIASLLVLPTMASAQVLLSENFGSQTVGDPPTGATAVRPTSNSADIFNVIVDSANNPAGSGNGDHIVDNNASSTAGIEWNFVASSAAQVSAVKISFDFARVAGASTTSNYFTVGVGAFDSSTSLVLNSSSNRFLEARLEADGDVQFRGTSNVTNPSGTGSNKITLFVNDFETGISYIAPDTLLSTALAANTVAFYLFDGTDYFTHTALLTGTTGASNLGRFGIDSTSTSITLDYTFDNFDVSVIPEPSTFTLLLGAFALASAVARRRK